MIIHDYLCQVCEEVTEHFITDSSKIPSQIVCPICNGYADKVFLQSKIPNVDAEWIKDVQRVVEKNTDKPWCKELLKHPTRQNLKTWMAKEGLRHRDPAEPYFKPIDREGRRQKVKKMLLDSHMERNALSITTTKKESA